ncbi:MAG TPA: hypothetical protein VKR06_22305, partial [Ktedonosporobacter sp.]|nr:hypothetical protein [Ktedonosporobacter sp.]
HGLDFLARLLRQAEAKQLTLPELGLPDLSDVAVITAQSVRALAKQLGLSYDTTEKYVVVFCQLRLLSKQRHQRQMTLHFPLCSPKLPEPEVLDQLMEARPGSTTPRYRPKVRSFASQVKRRFVAIRAQSKPVDASRLDEQELSQLLLQDIRQILGREKVDSEVGNRLLLAIEEQLRYRCGLGRLSAEKGDSEIADGEQTPLGTHKSPFELHQGDSPCRERQQKVAFSARYGDSDRVGRGAIPLRDSKKSPFPNQKGDSQAKPGTPKRRLSTQKGDSQTGKRRLSTEKGDSQAEVSEGDVPNVNVITILESLNVNVSIAALFCCHALGETPGKRGIYCKLFREVEQDAQAVTAAFLYTIVHRQDGTIQRPPAVFIQRCRDFHCQGIPEEAAVLVEQYGQLSYAQLLEALSAKKREPAQMARPAKGVPPVQTYQTPAGLPPITRHQSIEARIPLRPGRGLSLEEAKRLYAAISRDRRVGLCKTGLVALTDRTYAVLIDNTVTSTVRQEVIYSEVEWQARGDTLFGRSGPPPALQSLLKRKTGERA